MNCPKCVAKTFNVPKFADQAKPYVFKECKACNFLGVWNQAAQAWYRTRAERHYLDPGNPKYWDKKAKAA